MLKEKDLKRATLIEACIKGQCTIKQDRKSTRLNSSHD